MEFTAKWFLNSLSIEETVLREPRVVALLNNPHVVPMKVDLTDNNPDGNSMLKAAGR
jgi:thiol:disulfide interchange protein